MTASNWNPEDEERYMLALVPLTKDIADYTKAKLPLGTHFGVLVLVPSSEPGTEGRVLAITSDRTIVAHAAGQWVLNVMRGDAP